MNVCYVPESHEILILSPFLQETASFTYWVIVWREIFYSSHNNFFKLITLFTEIFLDYFTSTSHFIKNSYILILCWELVLEQAKHIADVLTHVSTHARVLLSELTYGCFRHMFHDVTGAETWEQTHTVSVSKSLLHLRDLMNI